MAGARAVRRAAGVERRDIGQKPIIAVANSYTQFVPRHVHLKPVGDVVSAAITRAGGIPREFNTIAVDDGIALGHGGLLYSLPSRDVIGATALVEQGDMMTIETPNRSLRLEVCDAQLANRREWLEAPWSYVPNLRERHVSLALRAFAATATSADTGAVRDANAVERAVAAAAASKRSPPRRRREEGQK